MTELKHQLIEQEQTLTTARSELKRGAQASEGLEAKLTQLQTVVEKEAAESGRLREELASAHAEAHERTDSLQQLEKDMKVCQQVKIRVADPARQG